MNRSLIKHTSTGSMSVCLCLIHYLQSKLNRSFHLTAYSYERDIQKIKAILVYIKSNVGCTQNIEAINNMKLPSLAPSRF